MRTWSWVAKPTGAVILVETETGNTVMDCVRKSMQACVPRFAHWPGLADGLERSGQVGTMSLALGWFDSTGRLAHPNARLIEASPQLLRALRAAHDKLSAAMHPGAHPHAVQVLVSEAHAIQSEALSQLNGASS